MTYKEYVISVCDDKDIDVEDKIILTTNLWGGGFLFVKFPDIFIPEGYNTNTTIKFKFLK